MHLKDVIQKKSNFEVTVGAKMIRNSFGSIEWILLRVEHRTSLINNLKKDAVILMIQGELLPLCSWMS